MKVVSAWLSLNHPQVPSVLIVTIEITHPNSAHARLFFCYKKRMLTVFNSEDFSFLLLSSKEFKTQIKTVLTEILKLVVTTSSSGECNHFNGSKYRPLWT